MRKIIEILKTSVGGGGTIAEYSLPTPLFEAYYYHFKGFKAVNPSQGISGITVSYLFPGHVRTWRNISDYLKSVKLAKKFLPFIDKHFPEKLSQHPNMLGKNERYYGLKCFLDTRIDKSKKEGDVFFIKTEVQDKIIYHIKDGDVEHMRILSGYQEAIDRYCEHVLLGKEERFDFLPYTIDFVSSIDMYDESLYTITDEEKDWWKSRNKTGDYDGSKWDVVIPKVYESLEDFEELKEKYL